MTAAVNSMAYVNEVPWHGLGNQLTDEASIDQWRVDAGLNWSANMSPVHFTTDGDDMYYMEDRMVVYRSDNHVPLGVVSNNFKVVQPAEVMEFFRDLTELGQFKMETAGVLFNGKKIWALARHAGELKLPGDDIVKPYLLLATGMDGSLATSAQFTTVRVVCNNTLQMSLRKDSATGIRVTHRTQFNEQRVKQQLGLVNDLFEQFSETAYRLAEKKVASRAVIEDYMAQVFNEEYMTLEPDDKRAYIDSPNVQLALDTYQNFPGQSVRAADGTAWGLVNGVTAFLDHVRNTRSTDARLNKAWFGDGINIKQRAVELALKL